MTEKDFLLVLSTCPSMEAAESMARALVEASLAACVNVAPGLKSIYCWNGSLQSDEEALMLIKTTTERFPALRERLVELHPYEVPEVVALPIVDGHDAYLRWIGSATASTGG
jgi:periplasmic divalent cation tolerance protein